MKHLTRLLLLTTACSVCVAGASASTLDSNSGTVTYLGYNAAANTPTFPGTSMATVNLGANPGTWTAAIGGSQWVSFENSAPGGAFTPPNGTYTFETTFNAGATGATVSLTVMADDTTSVYLNSLGDELLADAPANPATHCTSTEPNCEVPDTLATFAVGPGMQTLIFGVDQDFDNAMGLDFEATITPNVVTTATPEPSSLMLLGTGLLGAAGMLRRRIRA